MEESFEECKRGHFLSRGEMICAGIPHPPLSPCLLAGRRWREGWGEGQALRIIDEARQKASLVLYEFDQDSLFRKVAIP